MSNGRMVEPVSSDLEVMGSIPDGYSLERVNFLWDGGWEPAAPKCRRGRGVSSCCSLYMTGFLLTLLMAKG